MEKTVVGTIGGYYKLGMDVMLQKLSIGLVVTILTIAASINMAEAQPRTDNIDLMADRANRLTTPIGSSGQYPTYPSHNLAPNGARGGVSRGATPAGRNPGMGRNNTQISPRARAGRVPERAAPRAKRLPRGIERFSYRGRDFRVRSGEVVAIDLPEEGLANAQALGFRVLRSRTLEAIGTSFSILKPPSNMSLKKAIRKLQKELPEGSYEPNSIFKGLGSDGILPVGASAIEEEGPPTLVGMVDTGVFGNHEYFSAINLRQVNFGRGETVTPRNHGTMVAALSVKYGASDLLVADAFSGEGEYADAESISRALNWLASQDVAVINMSLAGPPNRLLEIAVERLTRRGHTIVAAVGNDGPDTPPQYPAAYDRVIGVTAVDQELNIYKKANQGDDVDISSIGVGISADPEIDEIVSGTSYATPAVAVFLAGHIDRPSPGTPELMVALVEEMAVDLGEPGHDPVFGFGFLATDTNYKTAGEDTLVGIDNKNKTID